MRLIDADSLMDRLRGNVLIDVTHELVDTIVQQPTAFDKEKVLDELKGEIDLVVHNPMINPIIAGRYIKKNKAIEIVKKGGIE